MLIRVEKDVTSTVCGIFLCIEDPAMQIVKFLVPEFVQEIGFTIEHLKKLKPLAEKLEGRHKYAKVIYDAYIENGSI